VAMDDVRLCHRSRHDDITHHGLQKLLVVRVCAEAESVGLRPRP
jgi:hypothetical protein